MRNLLKLSLCLLALSSCGGNKEKNVELPEKNVELGVFNLVFPDNNLICTEGSDAANDKVSIEFLWSASENATSYNIEITNQDSNEVINSSSTTASKTITLEKNSQFSWVVTAVLDDKSKESPSWSFYSEGIAQDNFAPFPATIIATDQENGFVEISWEGSDLDNDIKKYDLYFGADIENLELIVSKTSDEGSSVLPFNSGSDYHIKVITTDDLGNTSISQKTINF